MLPKITVCVPTYDRYQDLENLIQSYLSLQYANSSLLILDDLGSPKIEEVAQRYARSDSRIIYHKNHRNLGFTKNMRQGFKLAPEGVILFMGDDDIFIDNNALSYVATAFSDPAVGVAKCSQILHENGRITQAHPPLKYGEEIKIYDKPAEVMKHVWFETLAFSGLMFRVNKEIQSLVTTSSTAYSHTELAFQIGSRYKSARIHRYLVGIQSYSINQANTISYVLEGKKTTMLNDWMDIYTRTQLSTPTPGMSKKAFLQTLTTFLTIFYPYITLTSGKKETFEIAKKSLQNNMLLLLTPFFYISLVTSLLFPKLLIRIVLRAYKKYRLRTILTNKQIEQFNSILATYY